MKILLSHSGKQHSYQVAKAMKQLGVLEKFYTSSYIRSVGLQQYLLKKGDTFWSRRFEQGLGGSEVDANWRFEVKELLYRQLYGKTQRTQGAIYERDVRFDRYVARQLPRAAAKVFWGFQGSCFESLKAAKRAGKLAVCELATAHIAYAHQILGEEAQLQPAWADSIDILTFPPAYEERLLAEPHEADIVVAASAFTQKSLIESGVSASKIRLLPLGFDAAQIPFVKGEADTPTNTPLRLLYCGTVTQRKGVYYALEAVRQLNDPAVQLTLIGGIQGSGSALESYRPMIEYRPAVAQRDMFQLYRQFDALILPTLFEGFGLVVVEAMAAGLPVITTPHSIGPEVIEHERNGHIVPIRDIGALQASIAHLQQQKAEGRLPEMSYLARQAAERFTWGTYTQRLQQTLDHL